MSTQETADSESPALPGFSPTGVPFNAAPLCVGFEVPGSTGLASAGYSTASTAIAEIYHKSRRLQRQHLCAKLLCDGGRRYLAACHGPGERQTETCKAGEVYLKGLRVWGVPVESCAVFLRFPGWRTESFMQKGILVVS